MIAGCPASRILLVFLFSFYGFKAIAQPTLPDFAGNVANGVVVLSWNCQYSDIKSISVLRSADGLRNYSVIGYVENLEKGLQVFADGHPIAGKNCYKLGITFSSGLKWSSNSYCLNIEKADLESSSKLPTNDSIQKLIVTQDIAKPGRSAAKNKPVNPGDPAETNNVPLESAQKRTQSTTSEQPRVSVSFGDDTGHNGIKTPVQNDVQVQARKKIVISFQEPDESASYLIKSRFISTDPSTGHVIMNLPDDVATHHYSIKFYNDKNGMVTEVPRINAPKIILDKRNFQKKGFYKFKLHRDGIELETGYVYVTPNP